MPTATPIQVCLEVGKAKVFASALDWPGWCRAAKTEELALASLAEYADRYAEVTRRAGVRFSPRRADALAVAERVAGSATTDFGAPGAICAADRAKLTPAAA